MNLLHVLSRGVDKRKIFMDDSDYLRFIHDLFEFNDEAPVVSTYRKDGNVIARRSIEKDHRKLIVNIHAFCLMPNHYHLLLSARVEGGIPKFMKKLNMGYARYFNEKYERSGALFEGRYKRISIRTDAHFIHLPYYIHLNPLDLTAPGWRNRELKDHNKAMRSLDLYRWSSHLDYAGIKNFPSVTQREFLLKFFGNSDKYKKSIKRWLKEMDSETLKNVSLE